MKHLVLGYKGEVGSALYEVLGPLYYLRGIDLTYRDYVTPEDRFDVIHSCIPYKNFDQFIYGMDDYIAQYAALDALAIIHSTVPVGTSEHFSAVHSPIRGTHPNLAEGIRKFPKYFGGPRASEAAAIFAPICPTITTEFARTTEALKLWDTTYYGWNIVFEKLVWEYCQNNGLDFDIVYTSANKTYNEGYAHDKPGVRRPVMKHFAGPIGGHCVLPNAELLGGPIAEFLLKYGKG